METKVIRGTQEKMGEPESPSPFEAKVNEALAAGFAPVGGVSITAGAGYIRAVQTLKKCPEGSAPNREYKVITSLSYVGNARSFERKIRDAISDGWKPQGEISHAGSSIDNFDAQAFVRERK